MKPAPSRFRLRVSGLARLPRIAPGMRIGLYGGSFNPAHAGHRHVSLMALRRLGLDLDPGWLPWLGCIVRFAYDD